MKPLRKPIAAANRDDTSSVYSRSPDTAQYDQPPIMLSPLPIQISIPEITPLDHQIAMAGGCTMALELTRSRLHMSKQQPTQPLAGAKRTLLRQLEQQRFENDFYRDCFRNLHYLVVSTMDLMHSLALRYHFQSGAGPQDPRLIRSIVSLRLAVDKSRAEENQAECEWKQKWDVPNSPKANTRWL
ncbi:uncharacterized protein N7483_002541 [Penicillium malachiteum]|uniref:uncharacterized protein n=1 Tax=Penicillium malachiteum TaxID=1324776 RepID=UPI002548C1C7|nr:uncharacterized protein N7483_002541 [Penicillium malachiteum]KAJ5737416.1 hypothetical protein N7483_002541 [Penicillium malachiteum]